MKKSTFMNSLLIITLMLVSFFGIAGFWLYQPIIQAKEGIVFDVPIGMSKSTFIKKLSQAGVIHHPFIFLLYADLHPKTQLKVGEYLFVSNASFITIWRQVTTGSGLYFRPFSIIPGWNFKQVREALSQAPGVRQTLTNMLPQQIMTQYHQTPISPEGQFFPDTYFYTKGNSDTLILQQAYMLMQKKFMQAWEKRDANLPYQNAYEALIVASLVEKEAYLNTERPLIAGVIVNRLRKNMLLQIDPTVIYGMGDRYIGKISKQDLLEDTPYNTYTRKGLPPTPIAMPSLMSINAALHPIQHDYYYFVARGDGSHQFSKTLQEHNKAVTAANKRQHVSFFNDSKIRGFVIRQLYWI
ncbi:MAG: hypothetical protein ACD_46C00202G0002 [uncultured bacterium]|nr:MAG: hypothetical protein ACD_46C00202G0002 [uncultured bacterium]